MASLVFGTGGRFGRLNPSLAQSLVDYAWSEGIRVFDSGYYYCSGLSQLSLYKCLQPYIADSSCVVTSKVRADPNLVFDAITNSISSLNREYIDIIFLWGPSLSQLNDPNLAKVISHFLNAGIVKRFGVNTHDLPVMESLSSTNCFSLISDVMIVYSLGQLNREHIIASLKSLNINVWAGTALAQGFLIESIVEQFFRTRSFSYLARALFNPATRDLACRSAPIRSVLRLNYPYSYRSLPLAYVLSNNQVDFIPIGMMSRNSIKKNLFIQQHLPLFSSELDSLAKRITSFNKSDYYVQ